MKYFLSLFFASVVLCGMAQTSTQPQHARLRWKVISYRGKIGAATFNSCLSGEIDTITTKSEHTDIITTSGEESDLRWSFAGYGKNADLYNFKFTRKISGEAKTEAKQVEYAGRRIVVFQDDLHCVVMEPPSEEDLKLNIRH